jgi:aquaporin Z
VLSAPHYEEFTVMTEAVAVAPAPTLAQKLSAEAIGTFVLILFGVGAAVTAGGDLAAIGFAFGIAIIAMVYAFGRVSGGHFNPAVSVGAALGGRISWKEAGAYCGAQLVGGIVGGLVLALVLVAGDTGYEIGDRMGANGFGDFSALGLGVGGALIIEIVMTCLFLLVILAVTDTRNEHPALAPLAIGMSLAAIHFATINLTGTSVNPARSIGAALFSGGDAIGQVWLFIVAPLIGGAIAGLAYPAIFGHGSDPVPGSGLNFGSGAPVAVPAYGAPDQYQQQWNQQVPGYPQPQQPQRDDQLQQQWNQPQQQAQPPQAAQAAQPAQQAQPQPTQAQPVQPVEQPIIQDGWQWDPQAQQWIPAQQQPPQQQWPNPGGEQTQVRPPDGQ